ncbi:MAG: squalene--hopene cyclase [Planctomycetes bacterium]|nr:squalene--hopene cyclase [Planctomycetota bacterium]
MERTWRSARQKLLSLRVPRGHWEGELSSSALSTATAAAALEVVRRNGGPDSGPLVRAGLRWLAEHQNPDGGYGDTAGSPSSASTTTLCWAALGLSPEQEAAFRRAEAWLQAEVGGLDAASIAGAITRLYGSDRTFSVPILTMGALAGRLGGGAAAWRDVPQLPIELAALPRSWFRWVHLQVVSYALPALIAIGWARHFHRPARNPLARLLRDLAQPKNLRTLESIQPASGGFLEATPLTSFVTMSLAGSGLVDHPVTRSAVAFLQSSIREDGSWPIDTNLATWVTTLSVEALSRWNGADSVSGADREAIRGWLLGQQTRVEHPYTQSPAGAWAWTDLSGGVPDGDDTSGALLALRHLGGEDAEVERAAQAGVRWLLDLQNRDGGVPTFCRGWGKLPFDRSCPDLTAHALRAWSAWRAGPSARLDAAIERGWEYLIGSQQADGSWAPLWFGNQHAADQANPVYGTARVMLCAELTPPGEAWREALCRAARWMVSVQSSDGSFGGGRHLPPSIEETALAAEALAAVSALPAPSIVAPALARACRWLVEATAEGTRFPPAPIGLYFAKLWYWEKLYPIIFTVSALGRVLGRS